MTLEEERQVRGDRMVAFRLICAVWLMVGLLYLLPYVFTAGEVRPADALAHLAVSLMGIVFSAGLFVLIRKLNECSGASALAIIVAAVVLLALFSAFADIVIFDALRQFFDDYRPSAWNIMVARIAANFAVYWSEYSLVAGLIWTVESTIRRKDSERELMGAKVTASEAQTAVTVARLSALRYQLNPHFLFNCLNSISSLVMVDRKAEAEEMLMRLSDFLRATLADDPETLPSLASEFDLIEAYLAIERVRFGERMKYTVDCPEELRAARVPGLILQPLVENAIKYGVAPSKRLVTIAVRAQAHDGCLMLSVTDDGAGTSKAQVPGLGVGMTNLRRRLEHHFGEGAGMTVDKREDGFSVLVRMPLIQRDSAEHGLAA